jgi:hypothetical protein
MVQIAKPRIQNQTHLQLQQQPLTMARRPQPMRTALEPALQQQASSMDNSVRPTTIVRHTEVCDTKEHLPSLGRRCRCQLNKLEKLI